MGTERNYPEDRKRQTSSGHQDKTMYFARTESWLTVDIRVKRTKWIKGIPGTSGLNSFKLRIAVEKS